MATDTFWGLPTAKRQMILAAARQVFSEYTYDHVKISMLIKAAGIPRGSFYQYFDDKADVFVVLMEDVHQQFFQDWLVELKRQQGDLFVSFRYVLHYELIEFTQGQQADFLKNAFMEINFRHTAPRFKPGQPSHFHQTHRQWLEVFYAATDLKKLTVISLTDLEDLLRILTNLFIHAVAKYYSKRDYDPNYSLEELETQVVKLATWLQYGVVKKGS